MSDIQGNNTLRNTKIDYQMKKIIVKGLCLKHEQ